MPQLVTSLTLQCRQFSSHHISHHTKIFAYSTINLCHLRNYIHLYYLQCTIISDTTVSTFPITPRPDSSEFVHSILSIFLFFYFPKFLSFILPSFFLSILLSFYPSIFLSFYLSTPFFTQKSFNSILLGSLRFLVQPWKMGQ